MREFNSDDHYINYCGQESLRRNRVPLIAKKRPKCSTWVQSQKQQNDLCLFPMQTIHYHSNPNLCPDQQWQGRSSWTFLWWPTRTSRTNTKKRCHFHHRGLECKSRKSGDTWSNRQVWPWSTKLSMAKVNRILPRECTGDSKCPLPTTQEMTLCMGVNIWSLVKSDWLYSLQPKMEKLYTVSKSKIGSWLWLQSWTPYCKIMI